MKTLTFTFCLVIAFASFGFSRPILAADSVQDAREAFNQTATQIGQELRAKQTELSSLMADSQRNNPRVQELFKEMGELRGRLFIARAELDDAIGESGNGFGPGPERFSRGGPGFGCCGGGFSGRDFGPRYMCR